MLKNRVAILLQELSSEYVGIGADLDNLVESGGRKYSVSELVKIDGEIDEIYDAIRNSNTDIADIAKQTGMPEWKIKKIKEHVFFNEHQLRDGIGRFDGDIQIADAWERLQNGTFDANDLDLLNHEYFESKFESIFNTDYGTAHDKTIESGRTWDPFKEVK